MKNKSVSITKSNQLMSASYFLTAEEQRLILACISKVNPLEDGKLLSNKKFYLTASEFRQLFKERKNVDVYKVLQNVSKKLYQRSFTLKSNDVVIESRWVSEVGYHKDKGMVHLAFSPEVINHVTSLKKNFTSYKILNVRNMESIYGIRIYELIIKIIPSKTALNFRISDLKQILGIDGKYAKVNDFKRKVLDQAKKDINKYSDLYFDYKPIKEGKKIIGFTLLFKEKPESEKPQQAVQQNANQVPDLSDDFTDFSEIEINDGNDDWLVDDIDF